MKLLNTFVAFVYTYVTIIGTFHLLLALFHTEWEILKKDFSKFLNMCENSLGMLKSQAHTILKHLAMDEWH